MGRNLGGAKKRKKPPGNYRGRVENGGELGDGSIKRRRESYGSVSADRGYLENDKEADKEAPDAEGLLHKTV